jgi:hypothetical protein
MGAGSEFLRPHHGEDQIGQGDERQDADAEGFHGDEGGSARCRAEPDIGQRAGKKRGGGEDEDEVAHGGTAWFRGASS